jgi:hypothetical protein
MPWLMSDTFLAITEAELLLLNCMCVWALTLVWLAAAFSGVF